MKRYEFGLVMGKNPQELVNGLQHAGSQGFRGVAMWPGVIKTEDPEVNLFAVIMEREAVTVHVPQTPFSLKGL